MFGLFLFNKPSGPSSAQFLGQIKRMLHISKLVRVGHGGTLDPFASGLLIVGVSRAYTKLLNQQLLHDTKEYEADIILGALSDTGDKTGTVTSPHTHGDIHTDNIRIAIETIQQRTHQTPPQFSAVNIGGKKAYERARNGEQFDIQPKKTSLISCDIVHTESLPDGLIKVSVHMKVSAGFYIRSFARDLGELLDCGGYVDSLVRTSVGHFSLKNALSVDDLTKPVELYFYASGGVQNVGFRMYAKAEAEKLGLSGYAKNITQNNIEIVAQGPLEKLYEFLASVHKGPAQSHIDTSIDYFHKPDKEFRTFDIL